MALDVIIVGGGIVGLATAHRLLEQKPDLKIALFEKENMVSMHQTGNNSGVIHSGLYYKPGSLKAKNCIEGYHQLIDFCQLALHFPQIIAISQNEQINGSMAKFSQTKQQYSL
jgi:L-2-hydroxyglutarate oxidase